MRFGILGPLGIRTDDGTPVGPGGPRPRALLTLLLLDAGRTVSPARLIDGLYGGEPPAGAANALQSQISRLRGRLAPHVPVEGGSAGAASSLRPNPSTGRRPVFRRDHRTAFAEYETRIRDFAKGCQKISGNAGPFFAPPTERRIRSRDRMYRLLSHRLMAGFFKRLTEKAATGIELREYPA
jgi:hypothetical protein